MRVLLLQNLIYLPSHGGANKCNRLLLEALAARGHECRAVALATASQGSRTRERFLDELARRGLAPQAAAPGVDVFTAGGVEVHAVSDPGRFLTVAAEQARGFVPDVILISHSGPAEPLLVVAADSGRPFVYLAHTTLWLPFGPASFRPSPREAALLGQAAAVVAVSRFLAGYLERWGGVRSEILRFPIYGPGPFPDLSRFDEGFVTLVNPAAIKGISIFLGLAARFPEIPFAAVPTYRSTQAEEEALAERANVELLAAEDDVERIFARTRVLLMPSLWDEAFGVLAVEAMLRGIPVLASDTGGLPEAKLGVDYVLPVRRIERYEERLDDRGGLIAEVPEQDLEPWADTLGGLLHDGAAYRRLAAESHRASADFVSGLGWEPFEELFSRVADRGRAAASTPVSERTAEGLAHLSPERRTLVAVRLWQRHAGTAPEEDPSPVIAIEPSGTRRPLFLVHPIDGGVSCYAPLAQHLGPDQPLFAFRAIGLDDMVPMATRYVAAMRERQARGPYLLGGWSFGALVAYEMARQLEAVGEEVPLLALFDSLAPLDGMRGEAFDLDVGEKELFDSWARDQLGDSVPTGDTEDKPALVLAELKRRQLVSERSGLADLRRHLELYRAHRRALRAYRPGPYAGPIALFRTAGVPPQIRLLPEADEVTWGWPLLVSGRIDSQVVPGSHATLLSEPHVRELAAALGPWLG